MFGSRSTLLDELRRSYDDGGNTARFFQLRELFRTDTAKLVLVVGPLRVRASLRFGDN